MKNKPSTDQISDYLEDMLHIRIAIPEFALRLTEAIPENISDTTQIFISYLLDLGFIYTHEIVVKNSVGKPEGETARLLCYVNVDQNVYAVVTDLYHVNTWIQFTSYYPAGERIITTSQPGALLLQPIQRIDNIKDLTVQNAGSATVETQWKKHRRLTASEMPDETGIIFKPEQHLAVERSFYLRYVQHLLNSNILQQSDTQTVRFTRSGARAYVSATTSRSARRPKPTVEKWIGKSGKLSLRRHLGPLKGALAASALVSAGLIFVAQQDPQLDHQPTVVSAPPKAAYKPSNLVKRADTPSLTQQAAEQEAADSQSGITAIDIEETATENNKQLVIATSEDEMWRIAVENAEFFLLSNDGDPTPWVRTARKIAAGFSNNDSRLARTYFLAALLEPDYRVAEQQFNRALSIQTKTLGLYHAETAQTLEALAWIEEHNKESLDNAITHQRLAINIYRDIFGPDAEDTKAAQWKLEYFEDRLAGLRPKADSNKRLLPALARFSR